MRTRFLIAVTLLGCLLAYALALASIPEPRANTLAHVGLPQSWRVPAEAEQATQAVEFDPLTGNARWAFERIDLSTITGQGKTLAKRPSRFISEPTLPLEWRAKHEDLAGRPFDRGHLIPFADFSSDIARAEWTFRMLNVVPQDPDCNRNFWGPEIEATVRRLITDGPDPEHTVLWVATVPIYRRPCEPLVVESVGPHALAKPKWIGKAVLVEQAGEFKHIVAWIVPNAPIPRDHGESKYRVTPADFQTKTGLDVFSALPDAIEEKLETH